MKKTKEISLPTSELEDLSLWIWHQKGNLRRGKLGFTNQYKLEKLGVNLNENISDSQWEKVYKILANFKNKYGHCNVPYNKKNKFLGSWVSEQRKKRKKGILKRERINQLNCIGFSWNALASKWDKMFESLTNFKKEYGYCNVPQGYSKNQALGTWCNAQRRSKRKTLLNKERMRRLSHLGFTFEALDSQWEKHYQALIDFKKRYRHFSIPKNYSGNSSLSAWAQNQRQHKKSGTLKEEYIDRLNHVGFEWNPYEAQWNKMYQSLVDFKKQHGHCVVLTATDSNNKNLGMWVSVQRRAKKNSLISKERINRLNRIGFVWDAQTKLN
jgi:hypothetical protein